MPRRQPPPQPLDPQKKKELLQKEQRKLKQMQLLKKKPAAAAATTAPATTTVTPPAKEKQVAKDKHAASTQSPAPASIGAVTVVQRSQGLVRIPPTSTLTPKQGLLISAQNFEANLGWESLPMQTPSGNTFGSDKKFAMDWASADTVEVSSQRSTSIHPSSGSMLAKTLHEVQIATRRPARQPR